MVTMKTLTELTKYVGDIDEEWVDIRITISDLREDPPHPKMAQFGTVTDGESSLPFISWEASDQPELELGATYVLRDAFRDIYDNEQRVVLRSDTEVERVEDPTDVERVLGWAARKTNFREYTDTLYVTPVIDGVFDTLSRFVYVHGDRVREYQHHDYHGPTASWASVNHHVRVTDDGLELLFDLTIDEEAYRDKSPSGGGGTEARNKERKIRESFHKFITEFHSINGVTVSVDDHMECSYISQCADCGGSLYGNPGGEHGLFCNADGCDARYDAEAEPATIPRRLTVSGVVGPSINTVEDLDTALSKVGGKLKWSAREAMGIVSEHLAGLPAVAENDGSSSLRYDTRKDWGMPMESYTDVQVEFAEPIGTEVLDNIANEVESVGLTIKQVSYDDLRRAARPYFSFRQEQTTLKLVTSTMVTEYSTYSRLDNVIDENEDHRQDTFVILLDDDRGRFSSLVDDERFEIRRL